MLHSYVTIVSDWGTEFRIPLHHVNFIRRNWKAGKPWFVCSPMYSLTRKEIAQIVTGRYKFGPIYNYD